MNHGVAVHTPRGGLKRCDLGNLGVDQRGGGEECKGTQGSHVGRAGKGGNAGVSPMQRAEVSMVGPARHSFAQTTPTATLQSLGTALLSAASAASPPLEYLSVELT
jgi:hypothetical protein